MKVTCGIFIFDRDGLLLVGHPTNAPLAGNYWSIPKGEPDPGESKETTAIRETREESSIVVATNNLKYVGEALYKSGKKTLYAYVTQLSDPAEKVNAVCTSKFLDEGGVETLEIDRFNWLSPEYAKNVLHETQVRLLDEAIKLIKNGGVASN